MKFRRRKKDVVPQAVIDAAKLAGHSSPDATRLAALAHAGVSSVDQMKLHHWQKYMREFKESAAITDIFRDVDDDYDETTASDAWKEISDTKIYTTTHVGIGTSDPDVALHIRGAIKVEDGFSLAHNHGSHPSVAIDTQNFGIDETVNDLTGMGSNKYTKLYRVYGTNSQGVGKNWYWGYANDDYTNFSLSSDGAGGNDPDIGFVFTSTSELHCTAVHAALSGNADTATRLQTARQINGVAFDGSADITIPIPDLNASKITAGTLADARIPNLNASKITAGTLADARIPNLNASKITAGTLPVSRGGTGTTYGGMTINSSGIVTNPNKPAFYAWDNSSSRSGITLTFNSTTYNTGSHYNTSTSRFRTPVAGTYIFAAVIAHDIADTLAAVYYSFYVDGVFHRDILEGTGAHNAHHEQHAVYIVQLNAGQYVDIRSRSGINITFVNGNHGAYYRNCFQGALIG